MILSLVLKLQEKHRIMLIIKLFKKMLLGGQEMLDFLNNKKPLFGLSRYLYNY